MSASPEFRYQSLDHWRGIAALAVTFFHLFVTWSVAHPEVFASGPMVVVRYGWIGVQLFFVISGYCIAERIARQHRTGAPVGDFLRDRGWRILPAYWVVLALLLAIRLASAPFNHAPAAVTPGEWLLAIPLIEPWLHRASVLTVSWTLTCELFYYALAALCLLAANLTRRAWVGFVLAGLLGVAAVTLPALANQVAWRLLPHFLLGVVVWAVLRGLAPRWRLPAGLLLAGGAFALTWPSAAMVEAFTFRIAAVFALVLIALQPWDAAIARSRFLRPLAVVGTFSYSLYLVHVPITSPLQNLIARVVPPASDRFALIPLLMVTVAVAFAWCFYRWVEQPLEAVRRRRLARSPSPTSR